MREIRTSSSRRAVGRKAHGYSGFRSKMTLILYQNISIEELAAGQPAGLFSSNDWVYAKDWGSRTFVSLRRPLLGFGPYRTDTLHFVPETSFTLLQNQKDRLPAQL